MFLDVPVYLAHFFALQWARVVSTSTFSDANFLSAQKKQQKYTRKKKDNPPPRNDEDAGQKQLSLFDFHMHEKDTSE